MVEKLIIISSKGCYYNQWTLPMALTKQAKTLTKIQIEAVYNYLGSSRYPARNRLILLLSVRAGLRAKEIAALKWEMVTDAEGRLSDSLSLTNEASKGSKGGRAIPLSKDLQAALALWRMEIEATSSTSPYIITSERAPKTSSYAIVNKFKAWYSALGFQGASSHSGRRTAITNWARRISNVGGSLRDVQLLAGHSEEWSRLVNGRFE
jgi:integrase/recombinase XerD